MGIAFTSYSQTGSTTKDSCHCIKENEMRNSLLTADSLDAAKKALIERDTVIARGIRSQQKSDQLIRIKDQLHTSDSIIISFKDQQLSNLNSQKLVWLDEIAYQKKQVRVQKAKVVKIGGISIGIIGALTYLLIKK